MPATKSNFKSYEAQARLVRAIIAAHPTLKLNYGEINRFYGSDMTAYSLQHKMRHLRTQAAIVTLGVEAGLDAKDMTTDESILPKDQNKIDHKNIAKYFGESTPDGIQFQFRGIKKDAMSMKAAADAGGDPIAAANVGAVSTPSSSRTVNSTPTTNRTVRASGGFGSRSSKKRSRKMGSDDEEDQAISDFEARDLTPTKPPAAKKNRPTAPASARATTSGRAAPAQKQMSFDLTTSASDDEVVQTPDHGPDGVPIKSEYPRAKAVPPSPTVEDAPESLFGGPIAQNGSYGKLEPLFGYNGEGIGSFYGNSSDFLDEEGTI